jgi:hypothetical protein
MLFERSQLRDLPLRSPATRRVWDGLVRGIPDCWVFVARDEEDLADWMRSEELAVEEAPLRICRAIVDDDLLLLADTDDDGSFPDLS